jgi:hypothetical protein
MLFLKFLTWSAGPWDSPLTLDVRRGDGVGPSRRRLSSCQWRRAGSRRPREETHSVEPGGSDRGRRRGRHFGKQVG